jgi:hypothetical protein
MPVTQNGSYGVPVMARRDLHGDHPAYASRSFSSAQSTLSSPARLISNVRSQLVNSYSAIRDRLTHHNHHEEGPALLNSPSSYGGSRYTRSSSQSSTNGQTGSYNLRHRAPVHSTPRDHDSEDRKSTSKQHKGSQDDDEDVDEYDEKHHKESEDHKDNILVRLIKRILHFPLDVLSFVWHKLFGLPWWLLLPLLLFLGFYACKYSSRLVSRRFHFRLSLVPNLACKPFEHYPESTLYQSCRRFQEYANNVTNQSVHFVGDQTYNRGLRSVKSVSRTVKDAKDSVFSYIDDIYYSIKKTFHRKVDDVNDRVSDAVVSTKDNAKDYCDAGLQKVNRLVEELKREKEKYLGVAGHALKPAQEKELESVRNDVRGDELTKFCFRFS